VAFLLCHGEGKAIDAPRTMIRKGDEMANRDINRKERFIADSYEPLNIVAVSQGDERVVLSAQDFEKLLACRDIVLFALGSKRDIPYSLVENVMSSFG